MTCCCGITENIRRMIRTRNVDTTESHVKRNTICTVSNETPEKQNRDNTFQSLSAWPKNPNETPKVSNETLEKQKRDTILLKENRDPLKWLAAHQPRKGILRKRSSLKTAHRWTFPTSKQIEPPKTVFWWTFVNGWKKKLLTFCRTSAWERHKYIIHRSI